MTSRVNSILSTTYEEAAAEADYPYAVLSGINIIPLNSGDLTSFFLDIWTDDKVLTATVQLEQLCDQVRNELTGAIVAVAGIFAAHLGFENQNSFTDADQDLAHRRLSISARIFYY